MVECYEMVIDRARNEQYNVYTYIMIEVHVVGEIVNQVWSQIKTEQLSPPAQFHQEWIKVTIKHHAFKYRFDINILKTIYMLVSLSVNPPRSFHMKFRTHFLSVSQMCYV